MDLGLKGKVALVAGASQGMGRAAAMGFAREGAKVAICARGEAALNEAAAVIRKVTGGEVLAMFFGVQVRDRRHLAQVLRSLRHISDVKRAQRART